MNAQNLAKKLVVGIALVSFFTAYVWADKLQLQTGLGKDIKIQLRDVTIAEALEKIGQEAGVKFVLSDEAAWKLPQGEATRLSVMMQGPLADSMTEMLNAFFMRYAVGDEEITIYPRLELEHILGRPTAKQLELLRTIYTTTIDEYIHDNEPETIGRFLGEEVLLLPVEAYRKLRRPLAHLTAGEGFTRGHSYNLSTPVTLAQLLQSVTATWYLSGMNFPNKIAEIRVVSEREFRDASLDQMVDVSFMDQTGSVVLGKLAKWAGMELVVRKEDPAWLREKVSVHMQNTKLRQALRNVVSTLGGEVTISVEHNEIRIKGPIAADRPAEETRSGSEYVGKISIPMEGGAYYIEFMLREKDLTDELKKLWQEKMKDILKVPTLYELAPAAEPQPTDKTQEMQEVF
jgi:hypothetical protein